MSSIPLEDLDALDTQQIRVLLVDDHPLFRAGVRQRLSEHDPNIEVVGEAENSKQAQAMVAELKPNVVLMDIAMPGESGIEATRRIKQIDPSVRVIILSLYNDVQYIEAAVQARATGYLLKTVQGPELAKAVRSAFSGSPVMSEAVSNNVLRQLLPPTPSTCQTLPTDQQISDRELEVLSLVARGYANKEIAKTLQLSVRTIEAHLRSIFFKLQATSRTEAVVLAVKAGLLRLAEVELKHDTQD